MSAFTGVADVWPERHAKHIPATLPEGCHSGVTSMAAITGMDVVSYPDGNADGISNQVRDYEVLFVSVMGRGEYPVSAIRRVHPQALVIANPDPPPQGAFTRERDVYPLTVIHELAQADVIAVRDPRAGGFYRALLGKPTVLVPSPLGTDAFFRDVRGLNQEREDYILASGHASPNWSAPTIAVLAGIQRETGLPIRYYSRLDRAREYAEALGLRVDWYKPVVVEEYARIAAKARLLVDMYPAYSGGRNQAVAMYAGTPAVGPSHTLAGAYNYKQGMDDAWDSDQAVGAALSLLTDAKLYADVRRDGIDWIRKSAGFDAFREKVKAAVTLARNLYGRSATYA